MHCIGYMRKENYCMNILIYDPAGENAGGFIVDVCGEQAQIDITNTLPDTVHCMQNTFYTILLAENLTADDGFALLDVLNMQDSIRFPPHVIGVTPEWENYQVLSDAFDDCLFPLLIGEMQDETVSVKLMNKLRYLTDIERQNRNDLFKNVHFIQE